MAEPAPIQVYLTVRGADEASKFYQRAFGARENQRMLAEDKVRLMHCDMTVFGGNLMFSDEFPEMGHADTQSPLSRSGASVTVHVNLPTAADIDRVMTAAADAGARITQPAADQFWGARYGRLIDPFGHSWSFGAPTVEAAAKAAAERAAKEWDAATKRTAVKRAPPARKAAGAKKPSAKQASTKKPAAKKTATAKKPAVKKPAVKKATAKPARGANARSSRSGRR